MDLQPRQRAIIQEILHKIVPDLEIRCFGSRVTGGAKAHSDLDLALVSNAAIEPETLIRLKLAFEESDLPFRVEVQEWRLLDPQFKAQIEPEAEIWK